MSTLPPPRKFPPPCWTHDETVALIESYRQKWYSLRRTNLRSNDWEDVCAAVSGSCPQISPAKTAVQCRHKIEKLRKRYRTEKQKSLSLPGRFASSWVLFDSMDSMENGSSLDSHKRIKIDANMKNHSPNFDSGSGFNVENPIESVPLRFKSKNSINNNVDYDQKIDVGNGFRVKTPANWNSPPLGFRSKNHGSFDGNSTNFNFGSRVFDGCSSYTSNLGFEKRSGGAGLKREIDDPIAEMVSSIKLLGEGFIRMEKVKLEMAMEMEKRKMEMELRRNEMILESQQQIVDAFVQMFMVEKNKKR